MITLIKILTLILFSFQALSHPVIYKDGLALSSFNMASFSENYLMYSYSQKFAVGVSAYRFSKDDLNTEAAYLKLDHLFWRGNGEDYQANIYLHGGVGLVDHEFTPKATKESFMAGIEGDWETRKLYTSFKHFQFHSPALMDTSMSQMRVGYSPMLSDFKELQSWFMLQAMYTPSIEKKISLTPLMRFFYNNLLWEIGSSTRGEWMLNFMVHY